MTSRLPLNLKELKTEKCQYFAYEIRKVLKFKVMIIFYIINQHRIVPKNLVKKL